MADTKLECRPLDYDDGLRTVEVKVSKGVIIDKSINRITRLFTCITDKPFKKIYFQILTLPFYAGPSLSHQFRYGRSC